MADSVAGVGVHVARRGSPISVWTGDREVTVGSGTKASSGEFELARRGWPRVRALEYYDGKPWGVFTRNQISRLVQIDLAATSIPDAGTLALGTQRQFVNTLVVANDALWGFVGFEAGFAVRELTGLDQPFASWRSNDRGFVGMASVSGVVNYLVTAAFVSGTNLYFCRGGTTWYRMPVSAFTPGSNVTGTPEAFGTNTQRIEGAATGHGKHWALAADGTNAAIYEVTVGASALTLTKRYEFSPGALGSAANRRSLAIDPVSGWGYVGGDNGFIRFAAPGWTVPDTRAYEPGRILDLQAPSATEGSGTANWQIALAVDDDDDRDAWLNPQGPVPIELQLLYEANDTWSSHPQTWRGVVNNVQVQDGRVNVTAVPASQSSAYLPRRTPWTGAAQYARNGDTALLRLKSTLAEIHVPGSF